MPGMDGIRLLEALGDARDVPPIPVVMLTATSAASEIMRAAAAGAADYIAKPFEPEALAGKVDNLMRRGAMTVLVASGNAVMRGLVANRLRRLGLGVMEAADGKNALDRAREFAPELILLDQTLAGAGKDEALHALRADKRTRHIPMLYIAGAEDHTVIENLNTGAPEGAAILPFVPEKITSRVMDALGLDQSWA
jgi:CheY-like chemotaxis protein